MNIPLLRTIPFCALLSGCIVWPFPYEKSETPRITGRVINYDSKEPIEGVQITSESTWEINGESLPMSKAVSDKNGLFLLEKAYRPRDSRIIFLIGDMLSYCTANVSASSNGYESKTLEVKGPLRSSHNGSVCNGIKDIEVLIELQPEKI